MQAQLDRPLGRHAGALGARSKTAPKGHTELEVYHDAAGHAVRRVVHGDRAGPSAGEGGRAKESGSLAEFSDECRRMGTSVAALETAEKKGFDTGIKRRASVRPGLDGCRSTSRTSC